jgi:hypothetical protein
MNQYSNFGDTSELPYLLVPIYFLKSLLIARFVYWRDHDVKFQVHIVLRCSDDQ